MRQLLIFKGVVVPTPCPSLDRICVGRLYKDFQLKAGLIRVLVVFKTTMAIHV